MKITKQAIRTREEDGEKAKRWVFKIEEERQGETKCNHCKEELKEGDECWATSRKAYCKRCIRNATENEKETWISPGKIFNVVRCD